MSDNRSTTIPMNINPNTVEFEGYEFIQLEYNGEYSNVYKVRSLQDQRTYAIKKSKILDCSKKDMLLTVLIEEKSLKILSKCPFVCNLRKSFVQGSKCLLLEYCNGGSLSDYLVNLDRMRENSPVEFINRCRVIISEIVCALVEMKKERIVHRDLKPQNILLKDGHVRICDYGTAKLFKHSNKVGIVDMKTRYTIGCCLVDQAQYICPRILCGKTKVFRTNVLLIGDTIEKYGPGRTPFGATSYYDFISNVQRLDIEYPKIEEKTSPFSEIIDLCKKLLVLEPRNRLGFGRNGYKRLKAHPFFHGVDFKALAVGDVDNAFRRFQERKETEKEISGSLDVEIGKSEKEEEFEDLHFVYRSMPNVNDLQFPGGAEEIKKRLEELGQENAKLTEELRIREAIQGLIFDTIESIASRLIETSKEP